MSLQKARTAAEQLLQQLGLAEAPVDVEHVAKSLGLEVVYMELGADVSGLLVTVGDQTKICVNSGQAKNRRRFTVGHEVGHYVLKHHFGGEQVHVDKGASVFISYRNPRSSEGVDPKEIEANQFAACLLMPEKLVTKEASKVGRWPLNDEKIAMLAKKFQVSEQAMTIRLTSVGLI